MNIVLLGAPGSGKGTVSMTLVDKHGFAHVAPGDIFRNNIKKQTPLGLEIKKIVDGGNLVSDELVSKVVKDYVEKLPKHNNIIFDGFPRTIGQAEALFKIAQELNTTIDKAIYLDIPKDEVIKRLSSRLTCTHCGATYNSISLPPKVAGICDRCGSPVSQRKDDTPEAINIRFENYFKNTQPLINYYKEKNILETIPFSKHKTIDELINLLHDLNIF